MKMNKKDHSVILAMDIGNTTTSFALLKGGRVVARASLSTACVKDADLKKTVAHFKKTSPLLDTCLVCSVVPKALARYRRTLGKFFPCGLFVAGEDFKIPIKNRYRYPAQVGQDRLACAYAAMKQHRAPLIVIDFGTAMTIDVVSAKGEYQGGMIIPGIRLSLKALAEHTALLPQVAVQKPSSLIGRSTKESILSGIFYGYVCLIQGIVAKIKKELSLKPVVVLTGGYGHYMGQFLRPSIHYFDADLVFKGLVAAFCASKK